MESKKERMKRVLDDWRRQHPAQCHICATHKQPLVLRQSRWLCTSHAMEAHPANGRRDDRQWI